jgi:purine-binding chemotaxis protein CheW
VINLRGKVIPIVDLRMKFGLPEADCTDRTSLVVVDAYSRVGRVQIGIVVDHVSEVINVTGDQIEAPPEFGAAVETGYILGMAKTGRDVKILLDMDRVLSVEQMVVLDQA